MTDPARVRRLAERIRELVVSSLRKQVKDPRLGMVTVTDARLTGDLRDATIYYTVFGDAAAQAATASALDSATGLLRSVVGKALGVRFAPTLTFVQDKVPEQTRHIEELLERARDADAEVQRLAVGAQHAGDPNPYRVPDEDEDEDEDDNPAGGAPASEERA